MSSSTVGRFVPKAPLRIPAPWPRGAASSSVRTRQTIFRGHRLTLVLAAFLAFFSVARAAETIPPAPTNHFNDYARLVRADTAAQLNRELAQFERDTSNQILVAVFPRMQSDSSVEDYTVRVAQSWRVGQKARDNGAVLFVFQQSREVRIETGYGLEASLPDALCKQIIENEIVPRFRAGDFDAGIAAGARAMMAAARGEYRGTGRLVAQQTSATSKSQVGSGAAFLVVILLIARLLNRRSRRGGMLYGGRGRRSIWLGPTSGWGGGRPGGGFGGFGGGGGGGTFSGGGGGFGGGGAGGRW